MNRTNEWEEKARSELQPFADEIFSKFWKKHFETIRYAKYRTNEFDLECHAIDHFSLISNFSEELKWISEKYNLNFYQNEMIFILTIQVKVMSDTYFSQFLISVDLDKESIFFEIRPGLFEAFEFSLFEYRTVLKIVSDLCALDFSELINYLKENYSKYWINGKNAEIAANSINALCKSLLEKNGVHYCLQSNALTSVISYENSQHKWIEKTFIHKDFNENLEFVMKYIQNIRKDVGS